MINTKIARRYTLALYEIAVENNILDQVLSDLKDINLTIEDSRELKLFLKSPIIKTDKKLKTLQALFKGKISEVTMKFIEILCKKNREIFLHDISIDFQNLINERAGIVEAEISTAIELSNEEKNKLTESLKKYTGKLVQPKFTVNKDVKGGFIAKIKDTIIDASIKRQLELLREQFHKGSFINN